MLKSLFTLFLATPMLLTNPVTTFQSSEKQTQLMELYTSEGCSSCPPAEEWYSTLKNNPDLWKKFVPLAFHVDYWNNLGWVDSLSSNEFTQRQREYSRKWQSTTIYTPGFVLNGEEWRNSNNISETNKNVGILKAEVSNIGEVTINFLPANKSKKWQANIALLGSDISTKVNAGENNGRKLTHDFAVLSYKKVSLKENNNSFSNNIKLSVPATPKANYSIAVWVNTSDSITPVQAVGGYLK